MLLRRSIEWWSAREKVLNLQVAPLAPFTSTAVKEGTSVFSGTALKQGVTLYNPNGSLCTGLEACLRNGTSTNKCFHSDANAHARTMA